MIEGIYWRKKKLGRDKIIDTLGKPLAYDDPKQMQSLV